MGSQRLSGHRYPIKASNAIFCILAGGVLGCILSTIACFMIVENRASIGFHGTNGDVYLDEKGLRMYGKDSSHAMLLFGTGFQQNMPVLEIRDKQGEVKFRSTPEDTAQHLPE